MILNKVKRELFPLYSSNPLWHTIFMLLEFDIPLAVNMYRAYNTNNFDSWRTMLPYQALNFLAQDDYHYVRVSIFLLTQYLYEEENRPDLLKARQKDCRRFTDLSIELYNSWLNKRIERDCTLKNIQLQSSRFRTFMDEEFFQEDEKRLTNLKSYAKLGIWDQKFDNTAKIVSDWIWEFLSTEKNFHQYAHPNSIRPRSPMK